MSHDAKKREFVCRHNQYACTIEGSNTNNRQKGNDTDISINSIQEENEFQRGRFATAGT